MLSAGLGSSDFEEVPDDAFVPGIDFEAEFASDSIVQFDQVVYGDYWPADEPVANPLDFVGVLVVQPAVLNLGVLSSTEVPSDLSSHNVDR